MSLRILFSQRAIADLEAIWTYSADQWDAGRADAYIRAIRDATELLSKKPALSRDAGEIRPGLKRFSVGSHVLYFRISNDEIAVTRILHSRMDADRHL